MKKELYFYKGKLRTPEQLLNHKDCSKGINLTRLKRRLKKLSPSDAIDIKVHLKYPYRGNLLTLMELFNHPNRHPNITYSALSGRINKGVHSIEDCLEKETLVKNKFLYVDYYGKMVSFSDIYNMPDTIVSKSSLYKRIVQEKGKWDIDEARTTKSIKDLKPLLKNSKKKKDKRESSNAIKYPYNDGCYTAKQLSDIGDGVVSPQNITRRLRYQKGWSVELAFTTPSELSRSEVRKIKSTIHPDDVYRYGKDLESYIAMKKEKLRIKNIMSIPQSECSQYTSYLRYERTQENMIDREYVLGTL